MSDLLPAFVAGLRARMSRAFPAAGVSWDAEDGNLSLTYPRGDDDRRAAGVNFVHLLVDFSCVDDDDGLVVIHARPERVFLGAVASDAALLGATCDFSGADDFDDGLGNLMWTFSFPADGGRIASMAEQLAAVGAGRAFAPDVAPS